MEQNKKTINSGLADQGAVIGVAVIVKKSSPKNLSVDSRPTVYRQVKKKEKLKTNS